MIGKYDDLVGPRIVSDGIAARNRKRVFGLLVWHDPTTFHKGDPQVKPAFSRGMRDFLLANPRYISELCDLPDRLVGFGLIQSPQAALSFLHSNPVIAGRANGPTAQSTFNGKALCQAVCSLFDHLGLEYVREASFGIDPRRVPYKWDVTVYTPEVELWLELKAQEKPGSAEVKLFYNHLAIGNIGSQYLDNRWP